MLLGGGGGEQRLLGAAAYDLDADVVLLIITIILTASLTPGTFLLGQD